jgi:ankyrin repeat protein
MLQVVKSLVAHQHAAGIDWCEPRLYGDCWTPLMAAAVANRLEVAKFLLAAAGPAAGAALSAANRYGQTVLHIAARKGSQGLLRLLLEAGAGRAVGERDASGDTPMDIAARNRHDVALAEFRRVCCVAVA